jgi:hypothetical protein
MTNLAIHEAQHQALKALRSSPIKVLRDVQIARDGETLVLSGRVGSFYMKQMAQELVRSVAADCEVCNSILVADNFRDA